MKKTLAKILPHDKSLHLILGMVVYLVALRFLTAIISLIIVFVLSVAIEIYDRISGKGSAEVMDVVVTVLGGVIVYLILL